MENFIFCAVYVMRNLGLAFYMRKHVKQFTLTDKSKKENV